MLEKYKLGVTEIINQVLLEYPEAQMLLHFQWIQEPQELGTFSGSRKQNQGRKFSAQI